MKDAPEGAPIWFDLGSSDVVGSAEFYTRTFGWTASVWEAEEADGYTTFCYGSDLVAAVTKHEIDTPYHRPHGPEGQEGMPAIWTAYFRTSDPDRLAGLVEDGGGEIIMMPMDVMDLGRMAVFADPMGAAFAVWQPRMMRGAARLGLPGSVARVELVTTDPERATAFYGSVLGWQAKSLGEGCDPVWQVDGTPIGTTRPAGPVEQERPHWALWFAVDDCDATARTATGRGGAVLDPPVTDATGRHARLVDPQGAPFTVVSQDRLGRMDGFTDR